ncbi:MAG: 2-oxoglutarate dehydrogenase complex dihydrolipoyllysine-residue succinyltransferase [Pirellulales bacterium]|nr:2-oxoglutarate dehydrogenase complex dihydrolipoyllysine-residue succinyltransferase [Pirellulales bacterium]
MSVELIVPEVGESITEVQIAQWRKRVGDRTDKDENLVEIESDKATVELPAPVTGTLTQILKQAGEKAQVGEVIGYMDATAVATKSPPPSALDAKRPSPAESKRPLQQVAAESRIMPAADRMLAQQRIRPETVTATGPGGRMLKEDVERTVEERRGTAPATTTPVPAKPTAEIVAADFQRQPSSGGALATGYPREEELVVMSPIRRRIAERLVEAQQTAALLTTFNECDLGEVMALRARHREQYEQRYGVKLGFMSFFVKAVVDALKIVPQLNAEVRDPHIVYRNYYDIGIAVGGGKGLVVPILRNAEFMSFAEIEQQVADFGRRAAENKVKLEELQGGTFTISNGGVYGSMLSTPIINPPQSGILGLHAIQDRPVARNGQVVIRPMMYLALTYDHRIVDGREAVLFLKRIKDVIEEPSRMLLEI